MIRRSVRTYSVFCTHLAKDFLLEPDGGGNSNANIAAASYTHVRVRVYWCAYAWQLESLTVQNKKCFVEQVDPQIRG